MYWPTNSTQLVETTNILTPVVHIHQSAWRLSTSHTLSMLTKEQLDNKNSVIMKNSMQNSEA